MKSYKLNRLFNGKSGNCFDVAIDHGFFNEVSFLNGIENIKSAVDILVAAGPDAIQLTVGQAQYLQAIPGKNKPALVLRTDVANVYGKELPRRLFSRMIENPVEQAIRLDAVCVVVNLFSIPDEPEVTDQCIQNILKIKPLCDQYSMPLMVEPLVFRPNKEAGGYMVDGDSQKIVSLVRQGVELGADIIKGNIPVLVRGGGKASDAEILERTYGLMQQGAKGIVYGRNVIQHADPAGMTKALMAIVHEGAGPSEVLDLIK